MAPPTAVFPVRVPGLRGTLFFFSVGGFFLLATSVLNLGDASTTQIAVEESCKLLGVTSFFLGHFAALLGTLQEIPINE